MATWDNYIWKKLNMVGVKQEISTVWKKHAQKYLHC